MRFYQTPHAFYAGVDLHARSMFTHILDAHGNTVLERKRGKRKALSVLEAKIGRTVYHLMRKQQPFDVGRSFTQ